MAGRCTREMLLSEEEKSIYHESCPGCGTELLKNTHLGVPYKLFFYVWTIDLCAGAGCLVSRRFPGLLLACEGLTHLCED